MPVPLGKPIRLTTYFDANHAYDLDTRRSVTGVLLFANKTPVQWYCKRQNTIESSTYGSELVVGRIACELSMAMRYKLKMMGIPIDGPTLMKGDNMSVIIKGTIFFSNSKKKCNSIVYHKVRENVATDVAVIAHVSRKKTGRHTDQDIGSTAL
jgi:hypothetical protein